MKVIANKSVVALLAALLTIGLVVPVFALTTLNNNGNQSVSNDYYEGFFFPEDLFLDDEFVAVHEAQIEEQFGTDFARNHLNARAITEDFLSLFEVDERGNPKFPDFIGGIYFDEDGSLVILAVENPISRTDSMDVLSRIVDTNSVFLKPVTFSYAELHSAMREIEYFIMSSTSHDSIETVWNFISTYIDTINNRVVVELVLYDVDEVQHFRNTVVDSPVLYFRQATEFSWFQPYKIVDEYISPSPYN